MKKQTKMTFATTNIVLAGLMTAILCIVAPFSFPLPFSPVPISFATFILYINAYVLGYRLGTVTCLLYLLLGLTGIPVFSGFGAGIGKLAGPTGGYLIGYIFLALIGGFVIEISEGRRLWSALGLIAGTAVTYAFGTMWLASQMNLTFMQGLMAGVIPYLLGDGLKITAALIIGTILKSRIKHLY